VERRGQLWQDESYDHIVRDAEQLRAYQDYIAANPEVAHLPLSDFRLYRADPVM